MNNLVRFFAAGFTGIGVLVVLLVVTGLFGGWVGPWEMLIFFVIAAVAAVVVSHRMSPNGRPE